MSLKKQHLDRPMSPRMPNYLISLVCFLAVLVWQVPVDILLHGSLDRSRMIFTIAVMSFTSFGYLLLEKGFRVFISPRFTGLHVYLSAICTLLSVTLASLYEASLDMTPRRYYRFDKFESSDLMTSSIPWPELMAASILVLLILQALWVVLVGFTITRRAEH